MIAAQLDQNGRVINRIVVDNLGALPNLVAGENAVIGATYDDQTQTFTPPDKIVEIPDIVSMAAGVIAMTRANVISDVETAITALGGESLLWWQKSDHIRRDFPLVETMRVNFGWNTDFVDQLFVTAKQIENGG